MDIAVVDGWSTDTLRDSMYDGGATIGCTSNSEFYVMKCAFCGESRLIIGVEV